MAKSRKPVPVLPFHHFFTYAEVENVLRQLAAARPEWARLHSLGKSREGREVYCLTVTDFATGAPEDKPAYVIQGNIHASELSGTHAALFTARQLLADYPRRTDLLARVAFHIVPRINPDGAEAVATMSEPVRSRTDRNDLPPNTLVPRDLDGDGLILGMRRQHPDGNYALDPEEPRLLVSRRANSRGPFYKFYPEGEIVNWDGSEAIRVGGRSIDWNRQWSYDWRPEPEQGGAGDFPYSEPEMRHFVEFITAHPSVFGALGYHTGPAAMLRPPSGGSDSDIVESDLRRMIELGNVGAKMTGLPLVAVHRYGRKSARGMNLHGHFPSTGYQHWGVFAFEFELGTIVDSAGMAFDEVMTWETDEARLQGPRRVMRWWDKRGRKPRIFVPWKRFNHPQLGPVEIGGRVCREWDGMTMEDLKKRCAATYKFTLHHAAQHPWVRLEDVSVTDVGGGIRRVRARVANRGALPTHVSQRGAQLARLRPVRVDLDLPPGAELLSQLGSQEVGHLAAVTGSRTLEWFVKVKGPALGGIRALGGAGGNTQQQVRL